VVRPVGSERARKVDVRILAATNRDLGAMVAAKTFREDLYYRLNVIALRVPPLRERPTDIPLLVELFIERHASGAKTRITQSALERLMAYGWPGNVRQLENEIVRAMVLGDGVIDDDELSAEVAGAMGSPPREVGLHVRRRVDTLERGLVTEALERTSGNQTQAAKLLGLSRFGLQKMIKRLGVA
jgi:transcriptional regulator with PAS, ATPase and Fis domain